MFEDINVDTWQWVTGHRPVQLAIAGQNPTPVLHDLALDPGFKGTVLVEVTPYLFFLHPTTIVDRLIRSARAAGPGDLVDQQLSDLVERYAASVDGDTRLSFLLNSVSTPLRAGEFPVKYVPKGNIMHVDRSASMWRRLDLDPQYQAHYRWLWRVYAGSGQPPTGMASAVAEVSRKVANDVTAIRRRGGSVVFIRFPSGGLLHTLEERSMPRSATWDVLLHATGGSGIHFEDYAELRGFRPPEWSHLSIRQSVRFTKSLVPLVDQMSRKSRANISRDTRSRAD